ncbi:hypothetical protein R1flu_010235 [Riccia fluitans]|uniref:Uncharacterized protein n=1 Tax=Riccia fluitans TaxID=41844 RepID=A0ABD1Z5B2_9MARC
MTRPFPPSLLSRSFKHKAIAQLEGPALRPVRNFLSAQSTRTLNRAPWLVCGLLLSDWCRITRSGVSDRDGQRKWGVSLFPRAVHAVTIGDDLTEGCCEACPKLPALREDFYTALIGGVPSAEEVEEATRDLQATFVQTESYRGFSSPRESDQKFKVFEGVSVSDSDVECVTTNVLELEDRELSPTPPSTEAESTVPQVQMPSSSDSLKAMVSMDRNVQAVTVRSAHNSVVAHCVDLLQRDPDIQAAVVSLAKDPAIWDAFVKNEKVQELLRSRSSKLPLSEGSSKENSKTFSKNAHENPFVVALLCVKNMVFEVMDGVVDLVGNVFGFFDQKVFGAKESDPLDKPLKACMVLTILVLALVVFKRA